MSILSAFDGIFHKYTMRSNFGHSLYSKTTLPLKTVFSTSVESMTELRATGNLGLSKSDMVLFELGYGWHDGDLVSGDNNDWTNARARWFHLFDMDYSVEQGYRGWGTQVDMQLAGGLKGTDGQNVVSLGGLAGFGLN